MNTTSRQNQLYRILQNKALEWAEEGIGCSERQFRASEAALCRLLEESWEGQVAAILNVLLPLAKAQLNAWDWLTAELLFEAYALAVDNRAQAARDYLGYSPQVTDELLDRYNERIQRFSSRRF